jgi:hypothetical protein
MPDDSNLHNHPRIPHKARMSTDGPRCSMQSYNLLLYEDKFKVLCQKSPERKISRPRLGTHSFRTRNQIKGKKIKGKAIHVTGRGGP